MAPSDRVVRKMDELYDELMEQHPNSRKREELAAELRGMAMVLVVFTPGLRADDVRAFMTERALARWSGERMPSLNSWMARHHANAS